MYQPPQKTPQQKRRDGLIVISIIIGVVVLALILPMFNTKNPESSTVDIATTTNPTYSNTATGAGSSTQARFYESTATPIKGTNGNPWGYDFDNTGNLIYDPDPSFCNEQYFKCVAGFWDDTRGFVVQCNDGLYSHLGGVNVGNGGACPDDGGEGRTLYWH